MKIVWDKKPTGPSWDFRFKLPRQLMYKNMTVEFRTKVGLASKIFWDREIYTVIGNPWHLDYRYRFSPDLSLRFMNDEYDYSLLSEEELELDVHVDDGTYQFMDIQVAESIGTVDKQRHRKNGYIVTTHLI